MRNEKNLNDGYVYFIQCGECGPIKIGFSKHETAESRLTAAQVYNPILLTLLSVMPGGRRKEKELHDKFSQYNILGEWFEPNEDLFNLIQSLKYIGLTVNDFRRRGPNSDTHHFWKGSKATDESKRSRTARRYKISSKDKCQICNVKNAIDRLHKDGNLDNINPENILLVCRGCCMTLDGRLELLKYNSQLPRELKSPEPCIICNIPSKPLRKGKCHACNEYYRRNNKERSEILDV